MIFRWQPQHKCKHSYIKVFFSKVLKYILEIELFFKQSKISGSLQFLWSRMIATNIREFRSKKIVSFSICSNPEILRNRDIHFYSPSKFLSGCEFANVSLVLPLFISQAINGLFICTQGSALLQALLSTCSFTNYLKWHVWIVKDCIPFAQSLPLLTSDLCKQWFVFIYFIHGYALTPWYKLCTRRDLKTTI